MPTSVRLDPVTDTMLRRFAAKTGRTKSDILREAVAYFVKQASSSPSRTVYDLIPDLIGVEEGGDPTLSRRTGEAFQEKLRRGTR